MITLRRKYNYAVTGMQSKVTESKGIKDGPLTKSSNFDGIQHNGCNSRTTKAKDTMNSANKQYIFHLTGVSLCISVAIASALGLIAGRFFCYYYYFSSWNENETISAFFRVEDYPRSERGNLSEGKKAASFWKEDNDGNNVCNSSCCENLHIDIETVDSTVLNSEERIVDIMREVLNQSHQSGMISHQCNSLEVGGISCIGILSDSHLLLHSRSENGCITLSFFTYGPRKKVSDIFHGIEMLFNPSDREGAEKRMKDFPMYWTIKPCQNRTNLVSPSPVSESKRNFGDKNFHEAFVHPALFSHSNPKRMAIIGGGKNVLQEVVKHESISEIEIFSITAKNSDDWGIDCGDFVGWEERCNVNEILEIKTEPLDDHFSVLSEEGAFDVILVNIDPSEVENKRLMQKWFTNDVSVLSLYNSLSDGGMVVLQLGKLPKNRDPPRSEHWKLQIMSSLELAGFQSAVLYSESSSTFSVVMKSSIGKMFWYHSTGELELSIHKRIVRTHSGSSALKHFDGSTMRKYQIPHKAHQTAHCNTMPKPIFCGSLDSTKNKQDIPLSSFDVKMSSLGEGSGRGLFAAVDLKKGSTIGMKETRQPVYLGYSSMEVLGTYWDIVNEIVSVWNYVDGYGWESSNVENKSSYYVEPNVLTFSNHGCNGSYNIIDALSVTRNAERDDLTEQNAEITDFPKLHSIFMPYVDRHMHHMEVAWLETLRDIKAGEEIFCDYLFFTTSSAEKFYEETQVLKRICNGEEVGLITLSETKQSSDRSEL